VEIFDIPKSPMELEDAVLVEAAAVEALSAAVVALP
jgi:hypothetical protein